MNCEGMEVSPLFLRHGHKKYDENKNMKSFSAMANHPQELAQDAVCQSHTGHMTGL